MKEIIFILLCCFTSIQLAYGQNITIETDQSNYKFDAVINVTFEIDFKKDSVKLPHFDGLTIVGGPNMTSSMNIKDGETKYKGSWKYTLRPLRSGKLIIPSPTFYIDGKTIIGESKAIYVLESNYTEEELKELRFQSFIEDNLKPKGSYRYTLNDEFGYIEIFDQTKWTFHRKLTAKELKLLQQMK